MVEACGAFSPTTFAKTSWRVNPKSAGALMGQREQSLACREPSFECMIILGLTEKNPSDSVW